MPNNNNNNYNKNSPFSRKIGKDTYSLIDVDNLRKANQELEKQMKYYERRGEALRDELKLYKEIEKLDEKQRREIKAKQRDLEFYTAKLDGINESLIKNDKILEKWPKHMRNMLINPSDKNSMLNGVIQQARTTNHTQPKTINDLIQYNLNNQVSAVYDRVAKNVYNKYKRNGADFTDSKVVNAMYEEAQNKTASQIGGLVDKANLAAKAFQVASDTFSKAVNVWVNVATKGLNNQYNAFEGTFENISVRNGVTRQNYYDTQWRVNNTLSDLGLRNNIATSEVQNMWNTMANAGISIDMSTEKARADITARAIDNVLTQKIVPYLDINSQDFQILNTRLDNGFIKDIRGISKANLDIAGNNYATQELLQTLIDQVQPMSDEALQNLALGSTEMTSMINSMIANGYSKDAAVSYATQLYKTQQYSDQILSSGSTTERLALLNSINKGVNIYDPADYNNYIGEAVNSDQMIASWTNGYGDTLSGIVTNKVGSSTGVDYGRMWGALNTNAKNMTGTDFVNNSELTQAIVSAMGAGATSTFTNDTNQTQTTLQDITLENFMNELAVGKQGLGHWTDVIVTAIEGLGSLLTMWLGGKFISALAGGKLGTAIMSGANAAGGTLGLLGTTGAIGAAVIGGVAITDSILNKVTSIADEDQDERDEAAKEAAKANKNQSFGNATVQEAIESASRDENSGGFINRMANGYKQDGLFATGKLFGWGNSYSAKEKSAWKNQNWKEYNIYKPLSQGLTGYGENDAKTRLAAEIAYGLALDEVGMLEGTGIMKEIFGEDISTPQNLYQLMASAWKNKGVGFSDVSAAAQAIVSYGSQPYSAGGEQWDGSIGDILGSKYYKIDSAQQNEEIRNNYAEFKAHRQGLDYVPYDNYPAMLHEGEAVLTATTANSLRDLLGEYKETNGQGINFDTSVQNQTITLVNKLNELINAVTKNSGSIFQTSDDTRKAQGILNNSMRHMASTKNFVG